jgi:hypothetical protein
MWSLGESCHVGLYEMGGPPQDFFEKKSKFGKGIADIDTKN